MTVITQRGETKIESGIQMAIMHYLALLERQGKPIYWFRSNSFAGYIQPGNRSVGWVNNAKKGMPDIIVLYKGVFYGIEVKGPKGRQSVEQKLAQEAIEQAKGRYILAYSLDDVVAQLF